MRCFSASSLSLIRCWTASSWFCWASRNERSAVSAARFEMAVALSEITVARYEKKMERSAIMEMTIFTQSLQSAGACIPAIFNNRLNHDSLAGAFVLVRGFVICFLEGGL